MMVRMRWLEVSTQGLFPPSSPRSPFHNAALLEFCCFIHSLPPSLLLPDKQKQAGSRGQGRQALPVIGQKHRPGDGETTWSRPADPDEGCLHISTTPVLSRRTGQRVLAELLIACPPGASPSLSPGAVCRARKFFCMIAIVTRRIYKLHSRSTFCRLPFQNSQTDSGVSLSGALCGLHISSWLPVFRLLPSPLPGGAQAQD